MKMNKLWWLLLMFPSLAMAQVNIKGAKVDALTGYTVAGAAANNQVVCGNGTVGTYQASCGIAVATAAALATTPTGCGGGTPIAIGIAANGNANCIAAPGASGTLSDVTGSRSFGTTFTNSGSTAIYVSGYGVTSVGGDTSQITCTVNGIVVWSQQANATVVGYHDGFTCMVPPAGTYSVTTIGTTAVTLGSWTEFVF
jgi:hypothetical protein